MAIYTTNQARHIYVMKSDSMNDEGGLVLQKTNDNKIYFTYKGKGGNLRSDLIDLSKIEYIKYTAAADYNRYLKQATVTLNSDYSTLVSGQDYIMRIKVKNYMTLAEEPSMLQFGIVHATSNMTTSVFFKKMAISLARNISRMDTPMVSILLKTASGDVEVNYNTKEADLTGTYTGIVVKEVDQTPNWILGKISAKPVNFEVWTSEVTNTSGDEYIWGDVAYADSSTVVNNGTRIADMEYFYMGERGDIYRDVDSRNRIYTQYMVDPTQAYNTLDIHYAFTDSNESVQKSEKDVLIVSTNSSILQAVYNEIDGYLNPDSDSEETEETE